ncbi:pterocarpan synthase 1 [Trifolium pratense]|uniref:pterocarpan synthase 1 n=1 Tax=Trifolium pratense TaxID=57577 RepID=UPI001E6943A7|nr:pterocarpan synthase 1 [Trifolium pratense]
MLSRIIFFTAVTLATIAVIVLALVSPVSHNKIHSRPWLDLSLYIQQPQNITTSNTHAVPREDAGAFVFHRVLTEGPENTSKVVGKAQGFIIPVEQFQQSEFNVLYLTFDTPDHSGSLSVQAIKVGHKDREEFKVVGGTGSFAFVHGVAVFTQTDEQKSDEAITYHVKLQLEFPNHSTKLL